jgi:hypothetical protein
MFSLSVNDAGEIVVDTSSPIKRQVPSADHIVYA